MPRRLTTALLLLATILTGLAIRFAPLYLPYFLWKYLGSMLWASAVCWLLATLLPRAAPRTLAIFATLVSIAVEFSRLLDWPPLNTFRPTLAGRLLLGAIFSPRNIVAYLLAIALTAVFDFRIRRCPVARESPSTSGSPCGSPPQRPTSH